MGLVQISDILVDEFILVEGGFVETTLMLLAKDDLGEVLSNLGIDFSVHKVSLEIGSPILGIETLLLDPVVDQGPW